jgi:hypothetical protein
VTGAGAGKAWGRAVAGRGGHLTTPSDDTDVYAWAQQQAETLRAGQWEALDIEHVAEEIEDLWTSDRHNLDLLWLGLVECTDGACRDDMGLYDWPSAVIEHHRGRLADSLEERPPLRPCRRERVPHAYAWARHQLWKRRSPPRETPPEVCPWTFDQLGDEDCWPPEAPPRLPEAGAGREPWSRAERPDAALLPEGLEPPPYTVPFQPSSAMSPCDRGQRDQRR